MKAGFTRKYMICDNQEGYFDLYLFDEDVEIKDLENKIHEHKENCVDENRQYYWDLESIEKMIRKNYKVANVILLVQDDNAKEIMEI